MCCFLQKVHTDHGTHPASYWVPLALSLGAKRLEFEAGLSPPSCDKVKDKYRYTFTPCTFMVYKETYLLVPCSVGVY